MHHLKSSATIHYPPHTHMFVVNPKSLLVNHDTATCCQSFTMSSGFLSIIVEVTNLKLFPENIFKNNTGIISENQWYWLLQSNEALAVMTDTICVMSWVFEVFLPWGKPNHYTSRVTTSASEGKRFLRDWNFLPSKCQLLQDFRREKEEKKAELTLEHMQNDIICYS